MGKPNIICLTPVKNEQWILERFLKCASLWADHIIIADQDSEDRSTVIVKKFEKVILIRNNGKDYDESERQKMIIDRAREIPNPRILIALDADEILTSNFLKSPEWSTILNAPEGTVIYFPWVNIFPDMRYYWKAPADMPFGFVDDGSLHVGSKIHSPRVPIPENSPSLRLHDIKVMHYQYTDWERMRSKHRWYLAWERLRSPRNSPVSIYRQYHHMDCVKKSEIRKIPELWFMLYVNDGIDMTSVNREPIYRWDKETLDLLRSYGAQMFARDPIWDINWCNIAKRNGYTENESIVFRDPRSLYHKLIHRYLNISQPYSNTIKMRAIDRIINLIDSTIQKSLKRTKGT